MLERVQTWYREAVDLYGDDWPRIERHVADKLATVSQADRARLTQEFNALRIAKKDQLN
jgi:uncharacterized membrane protein YgcG